MRAYASAAVLLAALVFGALLPRVALATPSLDGCNGVLEWNPGLPSMEVYASGVWCLDADVVVGGDGPVFSMIVLHVGDVTIDCRGHLLEYTGTGDAYGIRRSWEISGLTVRNCRFKGFTLAVDFGYTDDFVIEDNVVLSSRADGFGTGTAIQVLGDGVIRRNRIFGSISRAIVSGRDVQVVDNLVDGVSGTSTWQDVTAIDLQYADGAEVRGNTVRGLPPAAQHQHRALTVSNEGEGRPTLVEGNVLVHNGAEGPIGVLCMSAARLIDNVIVGFFSPTAFDCTDVRDNDFSP
jgi:hypothetical protein